MNIRLTNQLNMVGSCITIARSEEYAPVWTNQEPAAFGLYLQTLQTGHDAVIAKNNLLESAKGGVADTKAQAESAVEEGTFQLARALSVYLKQAKDLTRHAQVDLTHSEIVQLRENDLVTKAVTIRDIGAAVLASNGAATGFGITTARIEALTQSIADFKKALGAPRGQIVNRSAILKDMETDTAGLIEQLRDLDDLVVQFDKTPLGKRFIAAWGQARIIIDRVASMSSKTPATPNPVPAA